MLQWHRKTTRKSKSGAARAQGMVEFALTLPILLMLLLGIFEFGRMLWTYSAVISAAREAARYGAAGGPSASSVAYYRHCDGIRAAAARIGNFAGIANDETGIEIVYDEGPGGAVVGAGCPVGGSGPILKAGDRIEVTVSAHYAPMSGIIAVPALNIESTVRRTVVVDVDLD